MADVDEAMLMAYLDGELDELRRRRVERALDEDEALRARLDTQRRLRERLAAHYGPIAEQAVPERLLALLEPKIVPIAAARPRRMPPLWQGAMALAATLVLGLVIGRGLDGASGPVGFEGGAMVAQGGLARALDVQLASAPAEGETVRIGVTFAATDGRLCRTFESAALDGLACRGEQGWRLVMAAAGASEARGEFRQAGGGSAAILAAAQEMMAGEPLDAGDERRARDSGWRAPRGD